MKTDVFISHSSQDRTWANALCAHLEKHKIRCWIAPRDVPAGGIWAEAIIDGIENTRVMVLLVSSHANASRQVINEVERAVSKGVIVLPVRLESVKPSKGLEYFLGSRHWLDALTPPMEQRLEEIGVQIERVLSSTSANTAVAQAPPQPPPAPAPGTPRTRVWMKATVAAVLLLSAAAGFVWWRTIGEKKTQTADVSAPSTEFQSPSAVPMPLQTETAAPSVTPTTTVPSPQRDAPRARETEDPSSTRPVTPTPEPESQTTAEPEKPAPITPAPAATSPRPTESGPTLLDVVLPGTVWAGAMIDSTGITTECVALVERRTMERVSIVAYFPVDGSTPARWNGTLTTSGLLLDGADAERQRVSLTAKLADGRLTGTWENDGGRRGTFAFAPNNGRADALVAGSAWNGPLRLASGGGLELTLRIGSRQDARVSGRCAVAGQRGEMNFHAILLGDRLFGVIQNLPLQGSQRMHPRFSGVVRGDTIAGTWTTDAGLSGSVEWTRAQ